MKRIPYFIILSSLCFASCQSKENTEEAAVGTAAIEQAPAPQPVDSAFLIIPGERIGKVNVGMLSEELAAVLPEPDSTDAAMGKALLYWLSKESGQQDYLAVYTEADFGSDNPKPTVKQIQVTSPAFQTPDNIHTGTPLSEIREKYTNLKPLAYYQNEAQQQVYIFDDQAAGIAFEVALPDSTCTAITVHQKGKDMTNAYLPLHPGMTKLKQP